MRNWSLVLLLLAALVGGCGGDQGLPPGAAEEPFGRRQGKRLYARSCASCHGEEGRGDGLAWPEYLPGKPADLRGLEPDRLETWCQGGGKCPDWTPVYSPTQLRDLPQYLAGWRP